MQKKKIVPLKERLLAAVNKVLRAHKADLNKKIEKVVNKSINRIVKKMDKQIEKTLKQQ